MRNSSLVECPRAEDVTGLNSIPKLGIRITKQGFHKRMIVLFCDTSGRGASYTERTQSGSAGGLYRSENAGMSSENYVRIIMAESLRF